MVILGGVIALNMVVLTAWLLLRRYRADLVLLVFGFLMTLLAYLLNIHNIRSGNDNFLLFSVFEDLTGVFSQRMTGSGLTIMLLCGYVGYMRKLQASDAITYALLQPMMFLRRYPYLAVVTIIPFGMLLCLAIPSAAGVAMLLVAILYPLLQRIGVSKMTGLSVILACTIFDFGVNSPGTRLAASELGMGVSTYFSLQGKTVAILAIIIMAVYYLYSSYADKHSSRTVVENKEANDLVEDTKEAIQEKAPAFYAILPLLPLLFSVLFSQWTNPRSANGLRFYLSLDGAILLSFFIALLTDAIRSGSLRSAMSSTSSFWTYMGNSFSTIITLCIAADFFSSGLLKLGMTDAVTELLLTLNLGKLGNTMVFALLMLLTTVITGSGMAAFAAFSSLIPNLALQFGMDPVALMLPLQMIAGFGRAVSPIAIAVIVLANMGNVSTVQLARRNLAPIAVISVSTIILVQLLLL